MLNRLYITKFYNVERNRDHKRSFTTKAETVHPSERENGTNIGYVSWATSDSQCQGGRRYLCRVYEFLQHRLKLHFKYELACEIIFVRYQSQSRSHIPGREYLSFATILTYIKREREMTDGWFQKYRNIEIITWKTNVLGTEMTNLIFFPYFCVSIFEWYDIDYTIKRKRQTLISASGADSDGSRSDTRKQ